MINCFPFKKVASNMRLLMRFGNSYNGHYHALSIYTLLTSELKKKRFIGIDTTVDPSWKLSNLSSSF